MLERLQSLPLWVFIGLALLLLMIAWWRSSKVSARLVSSSTSEATPETTDTVGPITPVNWEKRFSFFTAALVGCLAVESTIWTYTTSLPPSYAFKRIKWQLGAGEPLSMKEIKAGSFFMGSETGENDELPIRRINIPYNFQMSETEITFEQYDYFIWQMKKSGLTTSELYPKGEERSYVYPEDQNWGRGSRPVINVSWYDAKAYTNWLSQKREQQCRLPSESEWEYAARAETQTPYSWGVDIGQNNANCNDCGSQFDEEMTSAVGSFSANRWGLLDMHGNVQEWVEDIWQSGYQNIPDNGNPYTHHPEASIVKGGIEIRVLRGGNWNDPSDILTSSARVSSQPIFRDEFTGFRVVCTP